MPASKPSFAIGTKEYAVPLSPPWVMGIVNVTPDSFSDGGDYLDAERAVQRALVQIQEGAKVIDIGGESTRPGSLPIPADEQKRRVLPVIRKLREKNPSVPISIDTCLSAVAEAAIQAGADIVNDTSALRDDPDMVGVAAGSGASLVLMHRWGTPRDMQAHGGPAYEDVVKEVMDFFEERIDFAVQNGVDRSRIVIDPGIGFGKRTKHNLLLLREAKRYTELGRPVLIGASRKRFIGEVLGIDEPKGRDWGSAVVAAIAALKGASMIRAHEVRDTVQAVKMAHAVRSA